MYGDSDGRPLNEDAKLDPISPYGVSKKMSEEILSLVGNRRGIAGLHLRYFNPAGALNGFNFGECHKPETHLIPSIIYSMIQGWEVPVFGTNYATRDGTCLRDFIHIEDVAQAHLRALQYLERQPSLGWTAINLGSGKTKSVLEVIHCVEKVMGKKITIGKKPPRPGDPPELCADISRASDLLNWVPKRSLEEMIESHYRYEMHRIKDR